MTAVKLETNSSISNQITKIMRGELVSHSQIDQKVQPKNWKRIDRFRTKIQPKFKPQFFGNIQLAVKWVNFKSTPQTTKIPTKKWK